MGKNTCPKLSDVVQEFVRWQQDETGTIQDGLALIRRSVDVDVAVIAVKSLGTNKIDYVPSFREILFETNTFSGLLESVFSKHLVEEKKSWRSYQGSPATPFCLSHIPHPKVFTPDIQLSFWSSKAIQLNETQLVFVEMAYSSLASKFKKENPTEADEDILQEALDTIDDGFILFDNNEKIIAFNDKHQQLFPSIQDAIKVGKKYEDILQKQQKLGILEVAKNGGDEWIKLKKKQLKKRGYTAEQKFLDGRTIRQKNYQTPSGNVVAIRSDITELVAARQNALENEQLFRALLVGAPIPLAIDIDGEYVYANTPAHTLVDLEDRTLIGRKTSDFYWRIEDREDLLRQMRDEKSQGYYELDIKTSKGRKKTVSVTTAPIIYQGKKARFSSFLDVTDASIAQRALARSEQQNRDLLELIPDALIVQTDDKIVFVNESAVDIFKAHSKETLIGMCLSDLISNDVNEDFPTRSNLANKHQLTSEENATHQRLDGSVFPTDQYSSDVIWDGKPGSMNIIRDNSRQMKYKNSIIQKDNEMSVAQEIGHFGHWRINLEDDTVYWSDELYRIHGLDPERDVLDLDRAKAFIVDEDRQNLIDIVNATIVTQKTHNAEVQLQLDNGDFRSMSLIMRAETDKNGRTVSVFGVSQDITEQRSLEDKLRESQRMEAIGQLTGGIAHDFNNLLAVIQGNAELLLDLKDELDEGSKAQLEAIIRASDRGADLTGSMLAYSRKQPLRPVVIQLESHVEGMIKMLRRTLGENIQIRFATDAGLWPCIADPRQIEAALLNLALNARDAMPGGGILTIEARNIPFDENVLPANNDFIPGNYVMLSLHDTGQGIEPEKLKYVFEPFYSTKETGKGTGLGLSMVYGFTKQSGGQISIDSEIGKGTTVKIYLPQSITKEEQNNTGEHQRINEKCCVLVVEDDPDMRALTVSLLKSLDINVLEASDGVSALNMLKKHANEIDVLLTDVILPGSMNGLQIAERMSESYPHISVIYMSGYTENAFADHGLSEENVQLLQKPFHRADLADRINSQLKSRKIIPSK